MEEIYRYIYGLVMLVLSVTVARFWKRIDAIEAAANVGISSDDTRRIAREEVAALEKKVDSLTQGIDTIQKQQSQLMFHLMSKGKSE